MQLSLVSTNSSIFPSGWIFPKRQSVFDEIDTTENERERERERKRRRRRKRNSSSFLLLLLRLLLIKMKMKKSSSQKERDEKKGWQVEEWSLLDFLPSLNWSKSQIDNTFFPLFLLPYWNRTRSTKPIIELVSLLASMHCLLEQLSFFLSCSFFLSLSRHQSIYVQIFVY